MARWGPRTKAFDSIQPVGPLRLRTRLRHPLVRLRWITAGWMSLVVALLLGVWLAPLVGIARTLAPFWQPGRYLVVFENDAELRPTGGFIGSYAVVTVDQQRHPSVTFQSNIYKVDNAFTATHQIAPPTSLRGIVDHWALRDSNWAIDGQEAATTVAQFYQQETGQSVDGVIGVTAHVGQQLVGLLKSVSLPGGTRLTASTFYTKLNSLIEKDYFIDPANRLTNEPKTIIATLIRSIIPRLATPWHLGPTVQLVRTALETKFITLNFFDATLKQRAEKLGWANRVNQTSQHYLAINNANIAGLKSSQFMTQHVLLDMTESRSGPAMYQLTLTRTHHGTGRWPDHRNDNLTRIVLPAGATVVSATLDGQPVTLTDDTPVGVRTVFSLRIDTEPGASRTLVARLTVPTDHQLASMFTWQKQPGVLSDRLDVTDNGRTILTGDIDRDVSVVVP